MAVEIFENNAGSFLNSQWAIAFVLLYFTGHAFNNISLLILANSPCLAKKKEILSILLENT